MEQINQDLERLLDNRVRALALDVHDEPNAARIVLVSGVVQSLRWRQPWHLHTTCYPTLCLHLKTESTDAIHAFRFCARHARGAWVAFLRCIQSGSGTTDSCRDPGSGSRIQRIPGYFSAGFSEGPLGSVAVNVPVSGTPIGPTGM